jgi:hypothetical protein
LVREYLIAHAPDEKPLWVIAAAIHNYVLAGGWEKQREVVL